MALNSVFGNGLIGQNVQNTPIIGPLFQGDSPSLTPTALPANAKPLLDAQNDQANMTPEEIKARNMQGTEAGERYLQTPNQSALLHQSLGMDPSSAMSEAIQNRAAHNYGRGQALLNVHQNQQAPLTASSQQQMALASKFGQQQFANKEYEGKLQQYYDNQQARAAVVSSVFSLGGILGGLAMGKNKKSSEQEGKDNQSDKEYSDEMNANPDAPQSGGGEFAYNGEFE